MQFFEVNSPTFADGNRSRLRRWIEDANFPLRDSTVFMICENARGLGENTRLIQECLYSIAGGGPLARNDIVCIDRSSEVGHFDAERAEILASFCSSTGIEPNRVIYASQNELLKEAIPTFFASQKTPSHSPQHLRFHHYAVCMAEKYTEKSLGDFGYSSLATLPTKFLCLNNKMRPHRHVFASYILKSDLRDDFLLSFPQKTTLFDRAALIPAVNMHYPSFGWTTDAVNEGMIPNPKFHANGGLIYSWPEKEVQTSFLSIVTESNYCNNVRRVTEKSLKPLAYHRPFMILGSRKSLEILRRWGFETFADLWDESYDTADAPEDRLKMMLRTLHSLRERMRRDGARALIEACRAKCRHNQEHFVRGFENSLRFEFIKDFSGCLEALRC